MNRQLNLSVAYGFEPTTYGYKPNPKTYKDTILPVTHMMQLKCIRYFSTNCKI